MPQPADLILTHAKVFTVDASRSVAEAVAVRDGRVAAVGRADDVAELRGPATQFLDLAGRLVLPGFIDAHMHPVGGAENDCGLDLAGIGTTAACLDALAQFIAERPSSPVVFGGGWTSTMVLEDVLLASDIDAVVNDRPVWLADDSYHIAWVNNAALRAVGYTAATSDPDNGVIDRLSDGRPSGILREGAAVAVKQSLPPLPAADIADALARFQSTIAGRYGITTVHDAGANPGQPPLEPYLRLQDQDRLSMRFCLSCWLFDDQPFDEQIAGIVAERESLTSPLLQCRGAKLFADGVIEAHTAFLREPYTDRPDSRGTPMCPPDQFTAAAVAAAQAGLQIHIHAIGDAALDMSLDAIEAARGAGGGAWGAAARPLITHLQIVAPDQIRRMAELGVVAVPQPFWFLREPVLDELTVGILGQERTDHQYPMHSYWTHGILTASASDFPVAPPPDPLVAIQRAVLRSDPHETTHPEPLWPEEAVTVEQMVDAYTINGAYANFLENETGSIEVGKAADLAVLSRDILAVPPEEITTAEVELTLSAGRLLHAANPFAGLA